MAFRHRRNPGIIPPRLHLCPFFTFHVLKTPYFILEEMWFSSQLEHSMQLQILFEISGILLVTWLVTGDTPYACTVLWIFVHCMWFLKHFNGWSHLCWASVGGGNTHLDFFLKLQASFCDINVDGWQISCHSRLLQFHGLDFSSTVWACLPS